MFAGDRHEPHHDTTATHIARPVVWLVDRSGERQVLIDRLVDVDYGHRLAHAITEQIIASR